MSSPPRVFRVGLVGAGSVAQTIHLPTIQLCSHLFRTTALCDVSAAALEHCANKFSLPPHKTFTDYRKLVAQDDVDVVFILSSDEYHVDVAIAAVEAGKHVLIEKPMALTYEDADALLAAEKAYPNVVIMVGYMRRFAGAVQPMKDLIATMKSINYVRVRDIIGHNAFFVPQAGTFEVAPTGVPAAAASDLTARAERIAERALGERRAKDPLNVRMYRLLGGLGSHDLSLMRELLGGTPSRCLAAGRTSDGHFLHALFQYPGGFNVLYETGIDAVPVFDAQIEVFGDAKRVRVDYDTPFIKGLPVTINVREARKDLGGDDTYAETTIRPTFKDLYTLEYEALYDALTGKASVKTTVADAREDLDVFKMIMDCLDPAT